MVVYRYRQGFFCRILANDKLVKVQFYFFGRRYVAGKLGGKFLILVGKYFAAYFDTFIANKNIIGPSNKPAGHVGAFPAK
jgi:hypothetical protein